MSWQRKTSEEIPGKKGLILNRECLILIHKLTYCFAQYVYLFFIYSGVPLNDTDIILRGSIIHLEFNNITALNLRF